MTPTTETTAAQLLAAQAQIHEQMAERRRALAAMIADAQAELAVLDGKPAPKLKAKPGPKVGSKRAPKVNGTSPELDRALGTLMKTPNAAEGIG